ncbi:MAG: type II secretion system protein [Planctomycetota bacterium]
MCTSRRGLSLIELLVSIFILSTLLAISVPSPASTRQAAVDVLCSENIRNASSALFVYGATADNAIAFLPPEHTTVRLGAAGLRS